MEGQGHNFTANEIDALTFLIGEDWADATKSKNLTDKIISGNYSKQQMYDASKYSGLPKRHAAETKIFLMSFYDIGFYNRG